MGDARSGQHRLLPDHPRVPNARRRRLHSLPVEQAASAAGHGAHRRQGFPRIVPERRAGAPRSPARGFDNAILLDPLGNVAEFATANLFIAKDGAAHTPVCNGTFLNGITRQRVAGLLRDAGRSGI